MRPSALIGCSETISRLVPHPADALIGISLSSFMAGERSFAILFEPGDRRSLQVILLE
ncbi:hypothetical protein [Mesorhizobium sp. M0678]|uniref:hypothetical protein n=1 Tax=Mesorhizobium sp. M0678 TaxID=2956985 RepID=UPI003338A37D